MKVKMLAKKFAGFAVVGGVAFLIDYGVLMLLSQVFHVNPVASAFVSYLVSTVFNYLASMRYVFTHRDDMSRRREFTLFVIFSCIGLALNELIIWAGTAWWGSGPFAVTFSKLVATVIVSIWNFFSREHWLDADR